MPSTAKSGAPSPADRHAQAAGGEQAHGGGGEHHVPEWLDTFFPWMISMCFHLGIGLIVVFIFFVALRPAGADKDEQTIIVPNSFEDPAFSEHPGGIPNQGIGGDPTKEAAQDKLKELAKAEGWTSNDSMKSVSSLLQGNSGENEAMGIFAGSGASLSAGKNGNGNSEGNMAAYGTPGGGSGQGPRSSFYGTGGNATRIVYILDHSGSMLDNFDFLKSEAKRSVDKLAPLQFFAVVLVSDHVTVLGPGQLQRALPETKKQFADAISKETAEGQNDNLLSPFEQAFNRAFAMKPELIYFLTDGRFGDGLIAKIDTLNREKKVHINTIAFVTEEPDYKDQLVELAKNNGGSYHFVPERELGR